MDRRTIRSLRSLLLHISVICQLTFLLAPIAAAQSVGEYFVYDGVTMRKVHDRPEMISTRNWTVFYFKRNAPTSPPSSRWGQHDAKSADAVMQSVSTMQAFERRYEKWCRCSFGKLTFLNFQAPIAVIDRPTLTESSSNRVEVARKLHRAFDDLLDLAHRYNDAADLANDRKIPLPSGPLAEYLSLVHKSFDQWAQLKEQLEAIQSGPLDSIVSGLDGIQKSINSAHVVMEGPLKSASGDASSLAPVRAQSGNQTWLYSFRLESGTLTIDEQVQKDSVNYYYQMSVQTRDMIVGSIMPYWKPGLLSIQISCKPANPRCIMVLGAGEKANQVIASFPDEQSAQQFANTMKAIAR